MSPHRTDEDSLYWAKARQAFASDRLELTLLPTEQCNFRCVYCYETFAIGRMRPDLVRAIKRHLSLRAPDLRTLHVRWFGGEPLLALDIIEDVAQHAALLAETHLDLQQHGSVTTNGWLLTLETAARLGALGVRFFQITLDGPKHFHDTTRLVGGGQGSYERIHANLAALRKSDLPLRIELRLHLTSSNVQALDEYVDELCDTYLRDPRFRLEFFPIENLGGGASASTLPVLEHDAAIAAVAKLRSRVRPSRPTLGDTADRYVCYAAKGNAFLVRANGRLAKCTVAFEDERNDVGELLADGTLDLNQRHLRTWLAGWGAHDWSALQCPASSLPPREKTPLVQLKRKGNKRSL